MSAGFEAITNKKQPAFIRIPGALPVIAGRPGRVLHDLKADAALGVGRHVGWARGCSIITVVFPWGVSGRGPVNIVNLPAAADPADHEENRMVRRYNAEIFPALGIAMNWKLDSRPIGTGCQGMVDARWLPATAILQLVKKLR